MPTHACCELICRNLDLDRMLHIQLTSYRKITIVQGYEYGTIDYWNENNMKKQSRKRM